MVWLDKPESHKKNELDLIQLFNGDHSLSRILTNPVSTFTASRMVNSHRR